MKTNVMPEKIYIHKSQYWGLMANENNITKNAVEYTRTDAFIKKADEFISTFFHPDDTELIDAVLNRFHEHMKLK